MKKPKTIILTETPFGCSKDLNKRGKHSPGVWHCYECNDLYAIEREFVNSAVGRAAGLAHYSLHNANDPGTKGICKMAKNRTFTCEVCGDVFPEFPRTEKTYESVYGGKVTILVCMGCHNTMEPLPPRQQRRGPRYVPIWYYLIQIPLFLMFAFILLPLLGMTLNIGGFLGFIALPLIQILFWKEGNNVPMFSLFP